MDAFIVFFFSELSRFSAFGTKKIIEIEAGGAYQRQMFGF